MFADGSVHFLMDSIPFATFQALNSINGGEAVSVDPELIDSVRPAIDRGIHFESHRVDAGFANLFEPCPIAERLIDGRATSRVREIVAHARAEFAEQVDPIAERFIEGQFELFADCAGRDSARRRRCRPPRRNRRGGSWRAGRNRSLPVRRRH